MSKAGSGDGLQRRMGLLGATSTNIIGMVGIGPFLTIPLMVFAMGGPHIIWAWLVGALLSLADGLVYAQLGAALPGSGGPYIYLREAFRPFGLGRLMAFLFLFHILLVAPLSLAGGAVGFADYLGFYLPELTGSRTTSPPRASAAGAVPALPEHRFRRAPLEGDARPRPRHHRLGDRGRPHRESGASRRSCRPTASTPASGRRSARRP